MLLTLFGDFFYERKEGITDTLWIILFNVKGRFMLVFEIKGWRVGFRFLRVRIFFRSGL